MNNFSDLKASIAGGVTSLVVKLLDISPSTIETIADLSLILLYGAVGALGGWLMNRTLDFFKKKNGFRL